MVDGIRDAARRVAATAREMAGHPLYADILALLPVLDAVARSGSDGGRVERWARSLDASLWAELDKPSCERKFIGLGAEAASLKRAHAAIALADAERAAAVAEGWRAYEEARDAAFRASNAVWTSSRRTEKELSAKLADARAALDAAVRRLAGVAEQEKTDG